MTPRHVRRFRVCDGEMLGRVRRGRGLTTVQLAELVGVSSQTIRDWEAGSAGTRGITGDRGITLLRALRLDPRYPELIGEFVGEPLPREQPSRRMPAPPARPRERVS